jgi:dihydroflavonol-4-reductase
MVPDQSFWAGKRVCVTGGTGFLGHHLVQQLLDLDARVCVLALPPRPGHPLRTQSGVECRFGDVCDGETVRQAVADCDVILHTAGTVAVWGPALERMHAIHVQGTRNILEAAPPRSRVVHTSSLVAVGASRTQKALTEEEPFNLDRLRVDYVHAKHAAEQFALDAAARGQHVVIVNPGYLVGPEDHENSVMGRFCVRFWKGRLPLAPPGGFNLVDVRDVALGHLLAAERGQPGRRYLLGGENHTLRDFLALLAQAAGWRPRAIPALPWWLQHSLASLAEYRSRFTGREPYPAYQHVRLNRYYWFCSSDRAARELGYQPRPLPETLADTYRWHAAHHQFRLRGLSRWWLRPGGGPASKVA